MCYEHQTINHWHSLLVVIGLLVTGSALGHIKNEATQFPDIEFSDARFDIVVLVGAGIIPETPVFEPDKVLSNEELATWIALAEGLGRGGENPDTATLAATAIEHGLVASLDGNASYDDIDRLFFGGNLALENREGSPSKAEAATLIATALSGPAGATLLEKRGLSVGVSGEVAKVAIEDGHHGNAYVMTIGDTTLQMDEHGRVANGPTDLLQWQGRQVRRSFVKGSGDHANWTYLEAEPRQVAAVVDEVPAATDPVVVDPAVETAEPPPAQRNTLYWLLAIVVILGGVLFFQSRRSG